MKDNQLALAINTVPGESHGIAKATGTELAFPEQVKPGEPVIELLELKTPTDAETLAFTPTALYRRDWNSGVYTWINITQTPFGTLGAVKDYFIHANKLWWFDGADFYHYDGKNGSGAKKVTMANPSSPMTEGETEFWSRVKLTTSVVQRGKRWFY
ncbi:MAG: hypothetical protein RR051_01655, partial [Clostridiales bacterium]